MLITDYKCANESCRMALLETRPVDMIQTMPKVDDVLLCGACGTPSIITLTGTRPMTDDDFNLLSKDERKDLDFAQRAIKRHVRNN